MGCSQGRSKPQRLELKSTSHSHGPKSHVLQLSICLPEVVTLCSTETGNKLELWRYNSTEDMTKVTTFEPVETQDHLENIKAICTLKVAHGREEKRVLFASVVVTAASTVSSPSPPSPLSSYLRIWDFPTPFTSSSDLLELPSTETVHSLGTVQELLVGLSSAWVYVWSCRLLGGRKSVYGNLVITPAFQMSMGPNPTPGLLYLSSIDGTLYPDSRDRSRICGCASIRKDPVSLSRLTPYATVILQEETETTHKIILLDLKSHISKEFNISSPNITFAQLVAPGEMLLGVYTERYHCEIWKISVSGEVISKVSFHTTSKRLSLNPMDKFLSTAASTSSKASIKRRKLSAPILSLTSDIHSTIWVLCADGFIAGFSLDSLRKTADYRVNILCDVGVFYEQNSVFIVDKAGAVHRVALPVS